MHEIELKPSRWLGMLLLMMLVLAWLAIARAALPDWVQWGLGLAVAGPVAWAWRRLRLIAVMRLTPAGHIQCQDEAGEWRDVEVLGDSFVSTGLVVLRYRLPGQPTRTLSLFPDSGNQDDLRRLRVSLRWARHTRSDTSSPGAG